MLLLIGPLCHEKEPPVPVYDWCGGFLRFSDRRDRVGTMSDPVLLGVSEVTA